MGVSGRGRHSMPFIEKTDEDNMVGMKLPESVAAIYARMRAVAVVPRYS